MASMQRVGRRAAWPLQLLRARESVRGRIAIIGNAAHTLHPIAGQGFNLGLRDVAALAEVVAEAQRAGHDPGALDALIAEAAQLSRRTSLSQKAREDAYSAWTYFNNHRHQMDYPGFLAEHLPIGSGVTEACSAAGADPTITVDGRLLVFDNNWMAGRSRVVAIDPESREPSWEYSGTERDPLFSRTCGAASSLPNGNVLITESDAGRALEVTAAMYDAAFRGVRAGRTESEIAAVIQAEALKHDRQQAFSDFVRRFIATVYGPFLDYCIRFRTITLAVSPPENVSLETAVSRVRDEVEPLLEASLPADGSLIYGGSADNLADAIRTMSGNFLMALAILFLLMAGLFRSLRDSAIVTLTIPLAGVGGIIALRLLNLVSFQPMDLLTMIGFIILLGLVVNNAILLVDQTRRAERAGLDRDAAVEKALKVRLRPIFMSTFTTIFGMLPLVLMPGEGSVIYRGLATAIVGGMVCSLFFTLLLLPGLLRLGEARLAQDPVLDTLSAKPVETT